MRMMTTILLCEYRMVRVGTQKEPEEGGRRVQYKAFAVTPNVTVIRTGMPLARGPRVLAAAAGTMRTTSGSAIQSLPIHARFWAIEIQTCPYYQSNCEITMGIDIPGTSSTLTKPATPALLV